MVSRVHLWLSVVESHRPLPEGLSRFGFSLYLEDSTDCACFLSMCRVSVSYGGTLTHVHGVVVDIDMAHRHELESLVDALSGDQSIR